MIINVLFSFDETGWNHIPGMGHLNAFQLFCKMLFAP